MNWLEKYKKQLNELRRIDAGTPQARRLADEMDETWGYMTEEQRNEAWRGMTKQQRVAARKYMHYEKEQR